MSLKLVPRGNTQQGVELESTLGTLHHMRNVIVGDFNANSNNGNNSPRGLYAVMFGMTMATVLIAYYAFNAVVNLVNPGNPIVPEGPSDTISIIKPFDDSSNEKEDNSKSSTDK